MTSDDIRQRIADALPGAVVQVRSDDGVHFAARVVAAQFAGLPTLRRHQLVYQALGSAVGNEIHALALDTCAPGERAAGGAH